MHSNSPDALAIRGLVLFLSGRLPLAQQHTESALRFDPSHEQARQLRKRIKDVERLKEEGNAAFKSGDWNVAVEKYTEALEVRGVLVFLHLFANIFAADRRQGRGRSRRTDPSDDIVESSHYSAQSSPYSPFP
jgi:tetratricopeptide (TPR) repeat protein